MWRFLYKFFRSKHGPHVRWPALLQLYYCVRKNVTPMQHHEGRSYLFKKHIRVTLMRNMTIFIWIIRLAVKQLINHG